MTKLQRIGLVLPILKMDKAFLALSPDARDAVKSMLFISPRSLDIKTEDGSFPY